MGGREKRTEGVNEQLIFSHGLFCLSRCRQSDKGSGGSEPPCHVSLKDPF